jgi:Yip1 domain.
LEFEQSFKREENEPERLLNPFLHIWIKPRQVIRQILNSNSKKYVILLAMIGGFAKSLDQASTRGAGDTLGYPCIFLGALIGGTIGGIIGLYILSWLIKWTGKAVGGKGSFEEIKTAIAWSNVPVMWALILWIPEIILFGQELFTSTTPIIDSNLSLTIALISFGLIEVIIGVWTFVISLKCIAEAQKFSAWKALGNVILSGLAIIVPLLIIILGITWAM